MYQIVHLGFGELGEGDKRLDFVLLRILIIQQEEFAASGYKYASIRHCVFCMPILLRICLSGSAHVMQTFLKQITESKKIAAINYPSAVTALY